MNTIKRSMEQLIVKSVRVQRRGQRSSQRNNARSKRIG